MVVCGCTQKKISEIFFFLALTLSNYTPPPFKQKKTKRQNKKKNKPQSIILPKKLDVIAAQSFEVALLLTFVVSFVVFLFAEYFDVKHGSKVAT